MIEPFRIDGLEIAIVVKNRLLDDLAIQLAGKDARIAELEAECADLRSRLNSLIESGLASVLAQDACVGTFVDLNLALQEELGVANEDITAAVEHMQRMDERTKVLELELLCAAKPPLFRFSSN